MLADKRTSVELAFSSLDFDGLNDSRTTVDRGHPVKVFQEPDWPIISSTNPKRQNIWQRVAHAKSSTRNRPTEINPDKASFISARVIATGSPVHIYQVLIRRYRCKRVALANCAHEPDWQGSSWTRQFWFLSRNSLWTPWNAPDRSPYDFKSVGKGLTAATWSCQRSKSWVKDFLVLHTRYSCRSEPIRRLASVPNVALFILFKVHIHLVMSL